MSDRGAGGAGSGDADLAEQVVGMLGGLAASLGGRGEERPGQLEMAMAVALAVTRREPLAVQAGTGTGKSWAYLVGALAGIRSALPGGVHRDPGPDGPDRPDDGGGHLDHDDHLDDGGGADEPRIVVATATKALQDQLAHHDLPALAAVLDGGLRWAVLKGRSNYLCRQAVTEATSAGTRQPDAGGEAHAPTLDLGAATEPAEAAQDDDEVAAQVTRLVAWGDTTETGDRADLDFEPLPPAWSTVSVGAGECPGAKACPSGERCFAEAAYARARAAEVIVVNQHLFGAHVASGGYVLPDHDVVVIDEAHEAEDVMVSVLGVTLTPGRARAAARTARNLLSASGERTTGLLRSADTLAAALAPFVGTRLAGGAAASSDLSAALDAVGEGARQVQAALRALGDLGDQGPKRDRAARTLTMLVDDVAAALAATDEEHVTWVEDANNQPALRVAPIDVGGDLARVAWPTATAVLTSATVPPGVAGRLGLGRGAATLDVGSPFDYRSRSLLYVPHLPDPRKPGHEAAAHDELRFLVAAAGGRTLALFTSWRAMWAASSAVGPDLPYQVLVQGELPKPALIEAFRTDETSCLFATMGFWQGVDVPGSACSLVVVDRLPFPRPDDPLFEARRERAGASAFAIVDLPHVATKLAQGVGRLIRSSTDRGVVAVLDSRLAEKEYRRFILGALPPMRRSRDRADVTAFFAAPQTAPAPSGPVGGEPLGAGTVET